MKKLTTPFSPLKITKLLTCLPFALIFLGFSFQTEKENKWCYVEVVVPAEYKTVKKRVLKQGGGKAQFEMVDEQVLTKAASTKMLPAICEENLTSRRVKKIKKVLRKRGYPIKNTDGLIGDDLLSMLVRYQKEQHLSEGYFTKETLDRLGLNFKRLYRKNGKIYCYEKNYIPDDYETVSEEVISDGHTRTITRQRLKQTTHTRLEPCFCEHHLTKKVLKKIQRQLQKKGYQIEKINGIKDRALLVAITKFQKENDLPIGNFNLKTLEALDVK